MLWVCAVFYNYSRFNGFFIDLQSVCTFIHNKITQFNYLIKTKKNLDRYSKIHGIYIQYPGVYWFFKNYDYLTYIFYLSNLTYLLWFLVTLSVNHVLFQEIRI